MESKSFYQFEGVSFKWTAGIYLKWIHGVSFKWTRGGNGGWIFHVDAETMDAIEKWAADEFRSTNGQLQWIIAEALKKSGRIKKSKNPKPEQEEEENT